MDRNRAQHISTVLRQAVREGRWTQSYAAQDAHNGLDQALATRIQAGQPALEAMNDGLMSTHAEQLLAIARADYAACRLAAPTLDELRLLGAAADNVVTIEIPRTTRLARAA